MRNVFRAVALIYITLICHTALAQEASRYENLVVTGVDLYSRETMRELVQTDLPEPVVPAIST